jgi:hypothetical protein
MKWSRYFGVTAVCGYFLYCGFTPTTWHFIDNVDLIFHEAGHTIFILFGDFIHIAMGSGFQVLLPLLIAGYFFLTDQKVSAAITLGWTGQNLVNVSVYARDAILMQLPLLGGDGVMHDWHYLLNQTGLLAHTATIANSIYSLGIALIVISFGSAFYFVAQQKEQ